MKLTNRHILYMRRGTQWLSVIVLIYILWNTRYPLNNYINPEFYFLIDPLAMFITSIAERVLLTGLIFSGILLILTFLLGRAFCGWICPLGALLDLWATIKKPYRKLFKKHQMETGPGSARYVKYGILSALGISAVAGIQLAWFFDPITIFVRTFSFNIHPFFNRAVDRGFMHILEATDFNQTIEGIYNHLREGFLAVSIPHYPHTDLILVIFATVMILALVRRRFWCRYLCPLGAFLALPARFSRLRRDVNACTKNCGMCRNVCRMNAIRIDNSYLSGECILCMDCAVICPGEKTSFTFRIKSAGPEPSADGAAAAGISRHQFIITAAGLFLAAAGYGQPKDPTKTKKIPVPGTFEGIRPPGSLQENKFIQQCIRCGNCMKVCPTNVLQPSMSLKKLGGMWTPVLDTHRGYCEYNCNLCGRVCPTDAIKELTMKQKQKTMIGMAIFNTKICLPYAKGKDCLVCEEHCPVGEKAIKFRVSRVKGKRVKLPYVDRKLCIGCAICENKCPVEPERAIKIVRIADA